MDIGVPRQYSSGTQISPYGNTNSLVAELGMSSDDPLLGAYVVLGNATSAGNSSKWTLTKYTGVDQYGFDGTETNDMEDGWRKHMKVLKKQIFFIISLSLILISVCSCSNYSLRNNDVAKNNEGNATTTQQEQSEQKAEINLGDEFETSPNESGPEYSSYVFHSFDELKNAFYDSKSDGSAIDIRDNWNNSSELYKRLVNDIEGNKLELKYPILSGNYKTSLTSYIILSTLELYEFPWIWYRGEIDGYRIIVKISYVSEDILNYSKEHSMSETIRYIAPTAPNVDNYQSYPSYSSIVEKNIETDAGNISALVSVTSTNDVFIQYIFEDMLVFVQGSSSIVNQEIIKNIDFIASSDSGVDK